MQAAQASNNVPARYDPVRLRRPTTPLTGRGLPIGLGADLSATAAEPATEVSSVAAGAPARVLATPPTYLHPSLRRLADGSRPPIPEGSQPTCVGGNVLLCPRPQPLFARLPDGLRFLPPPLPAAPSVALARHVPTPPGVGGLRVYHVPL